MITLGIETSCDETAAAVVQNGRILSNVVTSSVSFHAKYGGVIPEIASRFHVEYVNKVTKKALRQSRKGLDELDLVAVTYSPGLLGSLMVGRSFAEALSYSLEIPLVNVDHLTAHLYANFLNKSPAFLQFPFIGVVVSGGHTNIFVCHSLEDFEVIGKTRDDAIGEAFDKVAKILDIGYPGGPKIEKKARKFTHGKPINFPRAYMDKNSFDFSLSGIKTAVFYYLRKRKVSGREVCRISWSFQEAVFDVLAERIVKACRKFGINKILLGGGVIANTRLRDKLKYACQISGHKLFYPLPELCVDNAAMVAGLGEALYRESLLTRINTN